MTHTSPPPSSTTIIEHSQRFTKHLSDTSIVSSPSSMDVMQNRFKRSQPWCVISYRVSSSEKQLIRWMKDKLSEQKSSSIMSFLLDSTNPRN